MKRKTVWLVMSCSIAAALLLVSCSAVVTEEAEEIAPPQEERVVTGEELTQPEEEEESLTPAQSPASVPETSTPIINDHSNVDRDDTNIDNSDSNLPSAGFIIERTRSDLNRAVREYNGEYTEPIIDTHIHLDPPSSGNINESSLKEIVKSIDSDGVDLIIVMPVPNEGIMSYSSIGTEQRKVLRQVGEDKIEIKIFCGSEYISNWLHDIYRNGYSESEFNNAFSRLSKDLNDAECSGIGEIGLYHFSKTGHQNIIEYPPTFVPFLNIAGLIAEKGVWMDLHAKPVGPDGISYENPVFGGLELLFQKYTNLKLILSHTAMTNPTNVRRILKTYSTVMVNLKVNNMDKGESEC
ncbi:hypothetical protein ACFLV6_02370 [Chloroflexota bacterium]